MTCKFLFPFPDSSMHCNAYYESSVNGKKHFWAHFPRYEPSKCPVRHPELLKGAVLDDKKEVDAP